MLLIQFPHKRVSHTGRGLNLNQPQMRIFLDLNHLSGKLEMHCLRVMDIIWQHDGTKSVTITISDSSWPKQQIILPKHWDLCCLIKKLVIYSVTYIILLSFTFTPEKFINTNHHVPPPPPPPPIKHHSILQQSYKVIYNITYVILLPFTFTPDKFMHTNNLGFVAPLPTQPSCNTKDTKFQLYEVD